MTELTVSTGVIDDRWTGKSAPARLDLCDLGAADRCGGAAAAGFEQRYRRLLGERAWRRLAAPVRRRFGRRVGPDLPTVYSGRVVRVELSTVGRGLTQLARLVGAPLPLHHEPGPASVTVTAGADGGQIWTRVYTRSGAVPQVIVSTKRFDGPDGLEEHLGYGLVMRLAVAEEAGGLVFRSIGYDLQVFGRRLAVPRPLWPGCCEIRHVDRGGGWFEFVLTLVHPRLGQLLRQVAWFADTKVAPVFDPRAPVSPAAGASCMTAVEYAVDAGAPPHVRRDREPPSGEKAQGQVRT